MKRSRELLAFFMMFAVCFVACAKTTNSDPTFETEATIVPSYNLPTEGTINLTESTVAPTIIETTNETEITYQTELATSPTTEPIVVEAEHDVYYDINTRGAYGRLTIPDVGVDVAVFKSPIGSERNQSIVNASDSALWMDTTSYGGDQPFIGDHKNQGFDGIKQAIPGETYAYVDHGDYVDRYICIANFWGSNTGYQVLDDGGSDVMYQNEGGIMMYTCNDHWTNITITYWQPA